MKRTSRSAAAALSMMLLTACASSGDPRRDAVANEETAGAIVGGIIGGVLGHQFGSGRGNTAMTVAGATAGALIGGRLARDRAVSRHEQEAAYMALESAPSGASVAWQDPDGYSQGYYQPQRTWRSQSGVYCREFQQTVVIGGREQQAYGTACRQPDGSWRVISGGAP
jgi:surface antigen